MWLASFFIAEIYGASVNPGYFVTLILAVHIDRSRLVDNFDLEGIPRPTLSLGQESRLIRFLAPSDFLKRSRAFFFSLRMLQHREGASR